MKWSSPFTICKRCVGQGSPETMQGGLVWEPALGTSALKMWTCGLHGYILDVHSLSTLLGTPGRLLVHALNSSASRVSTEEYTDILQIQASSCGYYDLGDFYLRYECLCLVLGIFITANLLGFSHATVYSLWCNEENVQWVAVVWTETHCWWENGSSW